MLFPFPGRSACVTVTALIALALPAMGQQSFGPPYPITIDHSLGETKIVSAPSRVAVLGVTDVDAVLALGFKPVLVNRWVTDWKRGVGPWAEPLLGGETPIVFPFREINLETVAAAEPDLIIGSGTMLDQTTYDKLTMLAPTTAPSRDHSDPYATTWDAQTMQVAKALGKETQAQALVDRVKGLFASARKAHPSWQGKTAATIINWNGQLLMYAASDNRGEFMKNLGFDMTDELKKVTGTRFNVAISEEKVDLFDDLDVLVVLTNNRAGRAFFERSVLFQALGPVKKGHVVYMDDLNLTMAMSGSTVLSIPYVLDALTSKISKAIGE